MNSGNASISVRHTLTLISWLWLASLPVSLSAEADAGKVDRQLRSVLLTYQEAEQAKQSSPVEWAKQTWECLNKSDSLIRANPGLPSPGLWMLRADVALNLNVPQLGWEAGRNLLKLGMDNNTNSRIQQLMAKLEGNGWLEDKPQPDSDANLFVPDVKFSMLSTIAVNGDGYTVLHVFDSQLTINTNNSTFVYASEAHADNGSDERDTTATTFQSSLHNLDMSAVTFADENSGTPKGFRVELRLFSGVQLTESGRIQSRFPHWHTTTKEPRSYAGSPFIAFEFYREGVWNWGNKKMPCNSAYEQMRFFLGHLTRFRYFVVALPSPQAEAVRRDASRIPIPIQPGLEQEYFKTLNEGIALLFHKDYANAIALLSKAAETLSLKPDAHIYLARTRAALKDAPGMKMEIIAAAKGGMVNTDAILLSAEFHSVLNEEWFQTFMQGQFGNEEGQRIKAAQSVWGNLEEKRHRYEASKEHWQQTADVFKFETSKTIDDSEIELLKVDKLVFYLKLNEAASIYAAVGDRYSRDPQIVGKNDNNIEHYKELGVEMARQKRRLARFREIHNDDEDESPTIADIKKKIRDLEAERAAIRDE